VLMVSVQPKLTIRAIIPASASAQRAMSVDATVGVEVKGNVRPQLSHRGQRSGPRPCRLVRIRI